jgi:hypothetical protein
MPQSPFAEGRLKKNYLRLYSESWFGLENLFGAVHFLLSWLTGVWRFSLAWSLERWGMADRTHDLRLERGANGRIPVPWTLTLQKSHYRKSYRQLQVVLQRRRSFLTLH